MNASPTSTAAPAGLVVSHLDVDIGSQRVLEDVSFAVAPGERVGLIGSSGSGKTMTARAVLGLLPETASCGGSVTFGTTGMLASTDRELAAVRGTSLGMVFQDPLASLDPLMRVGRQITETLRVRGRVDDAGAEATARWWCERVGLPDTDHTVRAYPHQLSGGQRQRVAIAAALAARPAMLVADEPTSALDVTVQADILGLLDELVTDHGSSLLFITHDVALAARITTRLVVMHAGRIVETGPTAQVVRGPRHPVTVALLESARATALGAR